MYSIGLIFIGLLTSAVFGMAWWLFHEQRIPPQFGMSDIDDEPDMEL
jgi:hypothetical protein